MTWRESLLAASDSELTLIAHSPAPANRPTGYKSFAKQVLSVRRSERLERLRAAPRPAQVSAFERCLLCGWNINRVKIIGGLCPDCYAASPLGTPAGYVRAGDDLPPSEVFSQAEIERLTFARWLLSERRIGADDQTAEEGDIPCLATDR